MNAKHTSVLVVGGGMTGVTAAVESAELAQEVYLVERSPSLGGRVAAMRNYFPKLCPPLCGLEINYRRIKENPAITVLTSAEVKEITGSAGEYSVSVEIRPRYIKEGVTDPITPFKDLEASIPDDYNYGMSKKRPAQVPHPMAYPYTPCVDPAALADDGIRAQLEALPEVDLSQEPQTMTLKVGSIIWATGWEPYDASRLSYLKYSEYADVITNVEFERLMAPGGPTAGKLLRPSDGKEAKRVAFVQCAGSRDEAHLPYCSGVCCMASLKQSTYVREAYEDAEAWIFYIDIRANKYESFYRRVQDDEKTHLVKGKPGSIERDPGSGELTVVSEDMDGNEIVRVPVDMVVLATGMVPATAETKVPLEGLNYDEFGFLVSSDEHAVYAAGCVKRPADVSASVQDATGASLRARSTEGRSGDGR